MKILNKIAVFLILALLTATNSSKLIAASNSDLNEIKTELKLLLNQTESHLTKTISNTNQTQEQLIIQLIELNKKVSELSLIVETLKKNMNGVQPGWLESIVAKLDTLKKMLYYTIWLVAIGGCAYLTIKYKLWTYLPHKKTETLA